MFYTIFDRFHHKHNEFYSSGELFPIWTTINEYYTVNSRSSARAYTVTASINTDSEGGSGMTNVVW